MGRHRLPAARLLIFCIAAVAVLCWPQLAAAQTITEFPLPAPNKTPYGIAAGPDGALWFTELDGNKIGRITTAGVITEFNIPTGGSNPISIAAGSDGALWFTEGNGNKIGRIPTTATPGDPQITEFALTAGSFPYGITAGPDGALWFVEYNANKIGRITTAGVITEFPISTAGSNPYDITAGPDGALWFTEYSGNKIGRITTAGTITEFDVPTANGQPVDITTGPDGALWFTENNGNKIGRITTAGVFTEFVVPTASSIPEDIAAGSDGALWFTEYGGNKIGRITIDGTITEFDLPTGGSVPLGITAGSDGALWFSERNNNTIGRIAPPPFTQQGLKLVGTGAVGAANQGWSVAVSADGNTAIVGGYTDNGDGATAGVGAAWVFTRNGGAWTQQGNKLVGNDYVGAAGQGYSVALSADGNTAIVGGVYDNGSIGAAWIYTRSGSTWTQQGSKLVGNDYVGTAAQGWSVALSGDGNTAIVGGAVDNGLGAAWVYTRSGSTWTQQGSKLVGTGAVGGPSLGKSVALSANGSTAIVGGPDDNARFGAAWVFTRSGSVWSQQGNKLAGSGAAGNAQQGYSVALSADGDTAIAGGYNDDPSGAAWVYTRSGGAWTQQGNKLVGTGAVGGAGQGIAVSLSADGNIAIIGGFLDNGGAGAVWSFTRSGGVWTQYGSKLIGAGAVGAAQQGYSVGVSADGSTAIVGGWSDNGNIGAAWVFVQTPTVTNVNPSSGTVSGGTNVTISGSNFTGATGVTFGGVAATNVIVVNNASITATTPAHAAGAVDVVVVSEHGSATAAGAYTYVINATATGLGSSANPSVIGQSVTFTATVTSSGATPTGSVTFMDGADTIGSGTLSSGVATFATSALALGDHSITAVYGGDTNFTASTSLIMTQTVNQGATAATVTPSANPSVFGQPVTFTATVTATSPAAGTPTGSVTFKDGSTTLGTNTLSAGSATFQTSSLAIGGHSITAVYAGDTNFTGSTSSNLTQTVNRGATSVAITSSFNFGPTGVAVRFTATVSASAPASGTPTGTVSFDDNGANLGSVSLSGGGATLSISTLGVGGHLITATYGGDTNFAGSASATLSQTVINVGTRKKRHRRI